MPKTHAPSGGGDVVLNESKKASKMAALGVMVFCRGENQAMTGTTAACSGKDSRTYEVWHASYPEVVGQGAQRRRVRHGAAREFRRKAAVLLVVELAGGCVVIRTVGGRGRS